MKTEGFIELRTRTDKIAQVRPEEIASVDPAPEQWDNCEALVYLRSNNQFMQISETQDEIMAKIKKQQLEDSQPPDPYTHDLEELLDIKTTGLENALAKLAEYEQETDT